MMVLRKRSDAGIAPRGYGVDRQIAACGCTRALEENHPWGYGSRKTMILLHNIINFFSLYQTIQPVALNRIGQGKKIANIFRLFSLNGVSLFGILKPQAKKKDGKPAQIP